MKHFLSAILIVFGLANTLQAIKPVERKVGKLNISVDPRMELLSSVQLLSNYPVVDGGMNYAKDIRNFFGSSSSHEAVDMTMNLYKNVGFSYDAPVAMMLYLSEVPDLDKTIDYSEYLIQRANGAENNGKQNLENYRTSLKRFAKDAKFEKFWKKQTKFYTKVIDYTVADLGDADLVKALEDYFNETQNSYNIIISPLFMGGYGPRIQAPNGRYDIYSCSGPTDLKDDIPYMSLRGLHYYVWHEFGHSFVNPLTEKHIDYVNDYQELFDPIAQSMAQQAYPEWEICVNEHIVRAVNVRLREIYTTEDEANSLLTSELAHKFIYIKPIIEKLKEFEKQRDEKQITFSDYYPELLTVFDDIIKEDIRKYTEIEFLGPINAISAGGKRAWIYPTNDNDKEALKIAQDYAQMVFNTFKSKEDILIADTTALNTPLEDYGIMAYGTIESNLFLRHHKDSFPFRMENNILYADKEYKNANLKLITCLPNPQNSKKGMTIYTAFSNKGINNINSVFHGGEDYIIFENPNLIERNGWYKKTDNWKF